jgi:two-component system sensor histidine kinase AdeS
MNSASYKLKRELAYAMATVTGLALAGMVAGMIIFYYVAWVYFPFLFGEFSDPEDFSSALPGWYEGFAFFSLWLIGTAGTLLVAIRFTRRLSEPLDAVALAARRLASGDLGARAEIDGPAFAETRQLVHDFNAMARQLAAVDAELRVRNAAISHELRTPLTILRGRLQGFADGVFSPGHSAFAGLVREVDTLTRIVDDLHLLSLANGGELLLVLEHINLAKEAATVIALIETELHRSGITVQAKLVPVALEADGHRIRQALLALLENVRRHAAPGIAYVETCAVDGWAILRVRDSGSGFPPGSETQVFNPFWRADDSRSRKSGGSGLGLAVVQAIAEAHRGIALARTDRASGGAVVEMHLPQHTSSINETAPPQRAEKALTSSP